MSDLFLEVAASPIDMAPVGGVPRRVKLLPVGRIEMRDGRGPYTVRDQQHAQSIVDATRAWLGSADFNFDYGHAVQRDQAAIAAGWAKASSLTAEPDGIYAEVEWTSAAAQKIAAREYRYLSPLFLAGKTGEVLQLKNAALVTIGAIDLPAVAAAIRMGGRLVEGKFQPLTLEELKAAARGSPGEIQTALTEEEQRHARKVGMDFAAYLQLKIRQMEEDAERAGIAASFYRGTGMERLSADERAACAALNLSHADFLAAKLNVPVAVAASLLHPEAPMPPTHAALSAEEIEVCAALGMSHADFLAAKPYVPAGVAAGLSPRNVPSPAKSTALSADEVAVCAKIGMSHADFLAAKNDQQA